MQLVEERAPDGFADIADVITTEEIADVTESVPHHRGLLARRTPTRHVAHRGAVPSSDRAAGRGAT